MTNHGISNVESKVNRCKIRKLQLINKSNAIEKMCGSAC